VDKKSLPVVCVGEMWRDTDPRYGGSRVFIVVDVGSKYAECRRCNRVGEFLTSRLTRIRIDRMRPGNTGYEKVKAS
jgi:hypothetical protein